MNHSVTSGTTTYKPVIAPKPKQTRFVSIANNILKTLGFAIKQNNLNPGYLCPAKRNDYLITPFSAEKIGGFEIDTRETIASIYNITAIDDIIHTRKF